MSARAAKITCRLCRARLDTPFLDLGMSPLANALLPPEYATKSEPFFPLAVYVCQACWLVQLPKTVTPARIFRHYAYFSSYSTTWLEHCRAYAERMVRERKLTRDSRVVELASNDGYLLRFFHDQSIPVLGIEPAANVAAVAQERGIDTRVTFFGARVAAGLVAEGVRADLIAANNVFAHVPDLNDFTAGIKTLLAPAGLATLEFPHLLNLLGEVQFDTIYHEHYSYFSLIAAERAFAGHGLAVVDVEELPTHGGSLRVHVAHAGAAEVSGRVDLLRDRERAAGLADLATYRAFGHAVEAIKRDLLALLIDLKRQGKRIAGYGAAAKGATLLNYCGIRTDFLEFVADKSPHKQGHLMPGVHVPVVSPERLRAERPDIVVILPWNLKREIMGELADVAGWGGRFLVPIPRPEVV